MELKRAEEIIASAEKIPVLYQGESIWIASLDRTNQTAWIKNDLFAHETVEVPVADLQEGLH